MVKSDAPETALTRTVQLPVTVGWNVIVLGCALLVVDCATAVLDPGGIRNSFRLALPVVHVSVAVIGALVSPTVMVCFHETVPEASTWPVKVSVCEPTTGARLNTWMRSL